MQSRGNASALLINRPPALPVAFCIDGNDDTLAAELLRALVDEIGIFDCLSIDRHLVGPCTEALAHVFHTVYPAPEAERHEAAPRDFCQYVQ